MCEAKLNIILNCSKTKHLSYLGLSDLVCVKTGAVFSRTSESWYCDDLGKSCPLITKCLSFCPQLVPLPQPELSSAHPNSPLHRGVGGRGRTRTFVISDKGSNQVCMRTLVDFFFFCFILLFFKLLIFVLGSRLKQCLLKNIFHPGYKFYNFKMKHLLYSHS